jgi:hypothetical protein
MHNQNGRILLLYGAALPRELITSSLAWILLSQRELYVIDGANEFDAHSLTRLITRAGQDPRLLLKQVHISRAFTCYQLAERLTSLIFVPAPSRPTDAALYLIGLLDTFYDENVPLPEVLRLLEQVLGNLHRLCTRGALIIISIKLPPVNAAARAVLVRQVQAHADVIYRCDNIGNKLTLKIEKNDSRMPNAR